MLASDAGSTDDEVDDIQIDSDEHADQTAIHHNSSPANQTRFTNQLVCSSAAPKDP